MCLNIRKIISVFLSVAMLLTASSLPALAEETDTVTYIIEAVEQSETEIEETELSDDNGVQETQPEMSEVAEEDLNDNIKGINTISSNDIILTATSQTTVIASGTCGNNVTWVLDNQGTLTISGAGDMKDYTISTIPWYNNKNDIVKVVINNGITYIGTAAFADCDSLLDVEFSDTVINMGESVFYGCSSLIHVSLSENMTIINEHTFDNCDSLVNITIPESVITIGDNAFNDCEKLSNVHLGNNLVHIGQRAFASCDSLNSIMLPDNITTIESETFYGSGLINVQLPSNLKTIEYLAFSRCYSLKSITFPTSVRTIGLQSFQFCKSLERIIIPEGVTTIGSHAFEYCDNLESVIISSSVTSIGINVFRDCDKLSEIQVDCSNTMYSSEDSVLFNKDKTILYSYPAGKIGSYRLPLTVSEISDFAFSGCSGLTEIVISSNIIQMNKNIFSGCENLSKVFISSNVSTINECAFYNCSKLSQIVLPISLKNIEYATFHACNNLTDIYYIGTQAQWNEIAIKSKNEYLSNAIIHYNSRIITYDYATNGGISSTAEYNMATIGENADLTPTATKAGYKFIGWNTNPNAKTALSSYTVTDNVTLYAIYSMPVIGVTLNKSLVSLKKGNTETLIATITPTNATNNGITWTSSNTNVATVSNGTVTAKAPGTATITVTTSDGGYTATCTVTVTANQVVLIGDANGDGEIDFTDAIVVLKHDAGVSSLSGDMLTAADANGDGEIDFVDAILILKYDSGLISAFN